MTTLQDLAALESALRTTAPVTPAALGDLGRAVFIGSGDSLASALIATRFGHRAMSAGDIAWMDEVPAACDTVVGISHSGTSGATVRALRLAAKAGVRTIAITSNPGAPLATSAAQTQVVETLRYPEVVPCAGHLMLGQGVAAVCGIDTTNVNAELAALVPATRDAVAAATTELPREAPAGLSILSLPDLRSAADFWVLKFIEACGLPSRCVPLEESGHVDYFIGPQPQLTLLVRGTRSAERFDRLNQALASTGQTVRDVAAVAPGASPLVQDLATAVLGTWLAAEASERWGRAPFRGGEVNMDAAHIKLPDRQLSV